MNNSDFDFEFKYQIQGVIQCQSILEDKITKMFMQGLICSKIMASFSVLSMLHLGPNNLTIDAL